MKFLLLILLIVIVAILFIGYGGKQFLGGGGAFKVGDKVRFIKDEPAMSKATLRTEGKLAGAYKNDMDFETNVSEGTTGTVAWISSFKGGIGDIVIAIDGRGYSIYVDRDDLENIELLEDEKVVLREGLDDKLDKFDGKLDQIIGKLDTFMLK